MTENAPKTPKVQKTEAERRAERLAEQLRANLRRRKAQSRAMGDQGSGEDGH
jgi:hypothetical protein